MRTYRLGRAMQRQIACHVPFVRPGERDLAVGCNRVGNMLMAQDNLPDGFKSYRDNLAIRGRLAKADPGNAGWRRDRSVSYGRVARLHRGSY